MVARCPGYLERKLSGTQGDKVVVRLEKGVGFLVEAFDVDARPVHTQHVEARSRGEVYMGKATGAGVYRFECIPCDTLDVKVTIGGDSWTKSVDPLLGTLRFDLPATGGIEVRSKLKDTQEHYVRVRLEPIEGECEATKATEVILRPMGAGMIGKLPTLLVGRYRIGIGKESLAGNSAVQTVTIEPGKVAEITIASER